jgi:hypothetical protein
MPNVLNEKVVVMTSNQLPIYSEGYRVISRENIHETNICQIKNNAESLKKTLKIIVLLNNSTGALRAE